MKPLHRPHRRPLRRPLSVLALLPILFACGTSGAPEPDQRPDEPELLPLPGDPEAAIRSHEARLKRNPDDTAALKGLGSANLELLKQAIATGGKAALIAGLFEDAARTLTKAGDADPADGTPLMQLAELELMRGGWQAACDSALAAETRFAHQHRDKEQAAAALRAAEAQTRQLQELRQKEGEEVSDDARKMAIRILPRIDFAKTKDRSNDKPYRLMAQVWLLVDRPEEALQALEEGLTALPAGEGMHVAFQDHLFAREQTGVCVAAYKRMAKRNDSPLIKWFLGRAHAAHANALRAKGAEEAAAEYVAAEDAFRAAKDHAPQFAESSRAQISIMQISRAHFALENGQEAAARAALTQAFTDNPAVAQVDAEGIPVLRDVQGKSYRGGVFELGRRMMERTTRADMDASAAFWREVSGRHDGPGWGMAWNNLGFICRDLGVAVQKAGDAAGAKALWEESYKAYSRAVELEGDDPRTVNDCGLMLVWHLERDWERAETLFRKAIVLGEARLQAMDENTPADDKNFVEEAVGDAWENLGTMAEKLGQPKEKAIEYYNQSVKYYRYQMRRGAARARALAGGEVTSMAMIANPTAREPAVAQDTEVKAALDAARKKLEENDAEGALTTLEKLPADKRGRAEVLCERGWASFCFAQSLVASGHKNASLIQGSFADAEKWLRESMDKDSEPVVTRLRLIHVLTAVGSFKDAATEATRLPAHVASSGEALTPTQRMQFLLDQGKCCFRAYAAEAAREGGKPEQALADRARLSYTEAMDLLEKAGKMPAGVAVPPAEVYARAAELEAWLKRTAAAVTALKRGVLKFPAELALVGQMVELAQQNGSADETVAAIKELRSRRPEDASLLWYEGRALFVQGNVARYKGRYDEARKGFTEATARFQSAMAKNPEFKQSSTQSLALIKTGEGWAAYGEKKLEDAAKAWLEAIRIAPDQYQAQIDTGKSAKIGLLSLGGVWFDDKTRNLAAAERMFRAAGELAPEDLDFANNHGLFGRDHGEELARQGLESQADAMFQASHASYSRALRLDPENARLLNDTALVMLYHVKTDLNEAEVQLKKAVECGEKQLHEAPPTDDKERKFLEEAVGDAYQNLGKLYLEEKTKRDLAKAKAALQKSLGFHPGAAVRVEVRRMLSRVEEIERKREGK